MLNGGRSQLGGLFEFPAPFFGKTLAALEDEIGKECFDQGRNRGLLGLGDVFGLLNQLFFDG